MKKPSAFFVFAGVLPRPASTFTPHPLPLAGQGSLGFKQPRGQHSKISEKSDDEIEAELLQAKLNKLTDDLPMFASFDPNNVDSTALPIPVFTASVILLGSLWFTYYLYDIGLNGFPESQ